jgi:hypothetical protein
VLEAHGHKPVNILRKFKVFSTKLEKICSSVLNNFRVLDVVKLRLTRTSAQIRKATVIVDYEPVLVAARSKARTVFRLLEHWDHMFESRSRHGCVSTFFCVMLSCVGSGFAMGWSSIQGVLPTVQM